MLESRPYLSICIATRNRSEVLAETLDALLAQADPDVEIVVVDGASTDDTGDTVLRRARRYPLLKYFPQTRNSGIDGDFDKAVVLAGGRYCWLVSDDDLPVEGAVERILAVCRQDLAAVIVDAEVYTADYSTKLMDRRLRFTGERRYGPGEMGRLLSDCGNCLSFIGALVVRRDIWLARDRMTYFGTEFVHVGVLFQAELPGEVLALGEPMLRIRYGVGGWAGRAFEVWMFKWPDLIWSFQHVSEQARAAVTPRYPWRSLAKLLSYRATGRYSWGWFRTLVVPAERPWVEKVPALLTASFPSFGAYLFLRCAVVLWPNRFQGTRWELRLSPYGQGR